MWGRSWVHHTVPLGGLGGGTINLCTDLYQTALDLEAVEDFCRSPLTQIACCLYHLHFHFLEGSYWELEGSRRNHWGGFGLFSQVSNDRM